MNKKVTKQVIRKKETLVRDFPIIIHNQCPACGGIGLARPEWVNSDKCKVCKGNGVII